MECYYLLDKIGGEVSLVLLQTPHFCNKIGYILKQL